MVSSGGGGGGGTQRPFPPVPAAARHTFPPLSHSSHLVCVCVCVCVCVVVGTLRNGDLVWLLLARLSKARDYKSGKGGNPVCIAWRLVHGSCYAPYYYLFIMIQSMCEYIHVNYIGDVI